MARLGHMEQLKKKSNQIKLILRLAKPGAVLLSQQHQKASASLCLSATPQRNLGQVQLILYGKVKGQHGSAEPRLLPSALTSPCSPSAAWMAKSGSPTVPEGLAHLVLHKLLEHWQIGFYAFT